MSPLLVIKGQFVSLDLFREGCSMVSAPIIPLRVYSKSREKMQACLRLFFALPSMVKGHLQAVRGDMLALVSVLHASRYGAIRPYLATFAGKAGGNGQRAW